MSAVVSPLPVYYNIFEWLWENTTEYVRKDFDFRYDTLSAYDTSEDDYRETFYEFMISDIV